MQISSLNAINTNRMSFKGTGIQSYINGQRMMDTFVRLAKVDTGSNEKLAGNQCPSTESQVVLANMLAEELREIGLTEVGFDSYGILTATMNSNLSQENSPVVGLIAHLDTCSDVPTGPVNPKIHEYKGGDIKLSGETTIFAEDLAPYVNKTIITSDGTTLLGADDKAGIAEILEALRVLCEHPELKHPTIKIAFTPDEEIGCGVDNFDIKKFGADVAYTVDGDKVDELNIETFNAFNPKITIKGINVHPGDAYGKMVSAIDLANEFMSMLPKNETPATTKDYQGYYHVNEIKGNVEETQINMLVRDFEFDNAVERVEFLENIAKKLNKKYPKCSVEINPNPRYRNMKEKLMDLPEVIEFAKEGIRKSGLVPSLRPVRGGTDGSRLSLSNLPTPNLGTGGVNFHSKQEFVAHEDMIKSTENIINILTTWAENAKEVMPKILQRRE